MGEAILALPEASGAVAGVKHMAEVSVAMMEVTLSVVVEVGMAMAEVDHNRANGFHPNCTLSECRELILDSLFKAFCQGDLF